MTASSELQAVLRDRVGPALRQLGFEGTSPTWILEAANGDRAVVNVQRSRWSDPGVVEFTVNLSVIPEPWWRWRHDWVPGRGPKQPRQGLGLWSERLRPNTASLTGEARLEPWWEVRDAASASAAADDVVAGLLQLAVPKLLTLTDRQQMLAELRQPQYNGVGLAVLLSDQGPSAELDRVLADLAARDHGERSRDYYSLLISWCQENAESGPRAQR